ncbi:MAG TPA: circadian clock protein KaiC [Candidatus Thermoplasmatota archaeon]|nr:circadian clock protein KaiC [Candidatus Thermoplasmatota archaeon]
MGARRKGASRIEGVQKTPSGIAGLDDITDGGLPRGRPTLVAGGAGSGKTNLACQFLSAGILEEGENGVLLAFEESPEDIAKSSLSIGIDLDALRRQGKLAVDHIRVDRNTMLETGEYTLDGLFVRLQSAVDAVGAKRVVLDTLDALFAGLDDHAVLRSEFARLMAWLKEKGLTTVVTAESGVGGSLTRHGLEEYVTDCVIALDNRLEGDVATRRIRVVKYRGSRHGSNAYPFLIDNDGLSIAPITGLELIHESSERRVSTGTPGLDEMLGAKGVYEGSTALITGATGTGKSSLLANMVQATCARGERCLYFGFEESPSQIIRNMRSIGVDLAPFARSGLLRFQCSRPTTYGLEMHLARMVKEIRAFEPRVVIVDPVTDFHSAGNLETVRSMLTRLVDHLKSHHITSVFSALNEAPTFEDSVVGISSIVDTWIHLRNFEENGERNRAIGILKSRGMPHSNQLREFTMSKKGIQLRDIYVGPSGVLTGSARAAHEAKEAVREVEQRSAAAGRAEDVRRKRHALQAQIKAVEEEIDEAARAEKHADMVESERIEQATRSRASLARGREGMPARGGKRRS